MHRRARVIKRAEPIDLHQAIADHLAIRHPAPEDQGSVRTKPKKDRKLHTTLPYVPSDRTWRGRLYVRMSAAMLMAAADDAKARRRVRIAVGLRLIRGEAQLTQQQVATASGMPRERIVEYEGALHAPSPAKLEELARALKVSPWEFEARGAQAEES